MKIKIEKYIFINKGQIIDFASYVCEQRLMDDLS